MWSVMLSIGRWISNILRNSQRALGTSDFCVLGVSRRSFLRGSCGSQYNRPVQCVKVGISKKVKKRENPKKVRRLTFFVIFFFSIKISIKIHEYTPNLSSIVPANQKMAFFVKTLAAPQAPLTGSKLKINTNSLISVKNSTSYQSFIRIGEKSTLQLPDP